MDENLKRIIFKLQKLCQDCNCHDESMDIYDLNDNAQILKQLLEDYLNIISKNNIEINIKEIQELLSEVII
jgi:hypothetical protein